MRSADDRSRSRTTGNSLRTIAAGSFTTVNVHIPFALRLAIPDDLIETEVLARGFA